MKPSENYSKDKLVVNLVWANIFGILILVPIAILYGFPFYFIWGTTWTDGFLENFVNYIRPEAALFGSIKLLIILLLGVLLHELIHGITWACYAKNGFKSIRFGVMWKMLTPYCHCKEPLRVRDYIIGGIMPAILLGLLPAIIAIAFGDMGLLIFGIFFTMAAAGDFLIVHLLRKENRDTLIEDHPSEAGCYIYRKME